LTSCKTDFSLSRKNIRLTSAQVVDIYQVAIRPLLFSGLRVDPEQAHTQVMQGLQWLEREQQRLPGEWIDQRLQQLFCYAHISLQQTLWQVEFNNPVGLAAGFDKDGLAAGVWSSFGFGFAELGTVTLHSQPGNPRPRLFRLSADQAILNRMGFNNRGAAALAEKLHHQKISGHYPSIPLGINLGKSKVTPIEEAAVDYLGSFRLLKALGDYFVVNVSSPNTPGLRSLQSSEQLELLLQTLQQENQNQHPILVKIAPDLEWEAIATLLELVQRYQVAGIIATNTTIRRDGLHTQITPITGRPLSEEAGGISGAPLRQASTDIIRFIYRETGGTLPIIGVGGIFTPEDAWEKITAGASLIQIYTGWIYEGPWMVKRILQGLVEQLYRHGLSNISEAVGLDFKNP